MSERLKRRKKGASRPSQEKAAPPEPLQPKYFEDLPEKPAREVETAPAAEMDEARRERVREPERARVREPELEQKTRAKPLTQPEMQAQPEAQAQPELHAQPEQEGKPEIEPAAALAHELSVSTQPSLRPTRRRRRRGGRGGARRAAAEAAARPPRPPAAIASAAIAPVPIAPVSAVASEAASPSQVSAPLQVEALATEPVAAELPPAVPTPAAQRASKGIVVLAIGLPGSGKTTWFKRHEIRPLSSDMMRTLLFDDVHEQRFQDLVFSNLRSILKARLIARRPTNYVDATNLTPQERHHWIKLAKDFGYEVHAVFFDVPLEVCIERHQRRDRVVPEDAMRRMAAKLKPPTFEEGFAKITVVRVKKKDGEPAQRAEG